jgi:hypothetical protein
MLFYVCAEDYDENGEPIYPYKECKKVSGLRVDRRNTDSPEKIPAFKEDKEYANKYWYGDGMNHRVVNGCIERDFEDIFCVIELNTIEELLNLQEKYGTDINISNKKYYIFNGEFLNTLYCN